MNHWVKKAGIIQNVNSEGQMIPIPPLNFHAFFNRIASQSVSYFPIKLCALHNIQTNRSNT